MAGWKENEQEIFARNNPSGKIVEIVEQTGMKPQAIEEIRTMTRKFDVKRVILLGSGAR